jgi:hypothetical protein
VCACVCVCDACVVLIGDCVMVCGRYFGRASCLDSQPMCKTTLTLAVVPDTAFKMPWASSFSICNRLECDNTTGAWKLWNIGGSPSLAASGSSGDCRTFNFGATGSGSISVNCSIGGVPPISNIASLPSPPVCPSSIDSSTAGAAPQPPPQSSTGSVQPPPQQSSTGSVQPPPQQSSTGSDSGSGSGSALSSTATTPGPISAGNTLHTPHHHTTHHTPHHAPPPPPSQRLMYPLILCLWVVCSGSDVLAQRCLWRYKHKHHMPLHMRWLKRQRSVCFELRCMQRRFMLAIVRLRFV